MVHHKTGNAASSDTGRRYVRRDDPLEWRLVVDLNGEREIGEGERRKVFVAGGANRSCEDLLTAISASVELKSVDKENLPL